MIVRTDCRHFDGYKPCRFRRPCDGCPHVDVPSARVLIVNLDHLGDVVRSTALLGPLHRALPGAHVTWITLPRAAELLRHVEGLDRVVPLGPAVGPMLAVLEFDLVLGVDKSLEAGALTRAARSPERRGFAVDRHGAIVPLSAGAEELYAQGLDDDAKFRHNRKPMTRLVCEALGLPYARDPYRVTLSEGERAAVRAWRAGHGLPPGAALIGFNTGSSEALRHKRLPLPRLAALIEAVAARCPDAALALLGGPEDTARNRALAQRVRVPRLLQTPTEEGLRRGLEAVAACDVVVTADSLAMHMAIALGVRVVAWFTVSSHHEIDFYDRGEAVLAGVDCRPCMRAECDREPHCTDRVPQDALVDAVVRQLEARGDDVE